MLHTCIRLSRFDSVLQTKNTCAHEHTCTHTHQSLLLLKVPLNSTDVTPMVGKEAKAKSVLGRSKRRVATTPSWREKGTS